MSADVTLRRQLEQMRWPSAQASAFAYAGPADFVLQHGKRFKPAPFPETMRPGLPGHCFANAIFYAATMGYPYVEGYAIMPSPLPAIATQHAWNIGPDGRLFDATWLPPGRAYLGVAFAVERADDCTWEGDATVLDDFVRRWPLLKERWTGERDDWQPSERILAIRRGQNFS